MTKHIRDMAPPSGIENVSRRGVLKGMVSTGGLVLALTVLPTTDITRVVGSLCATQAAGRLRSTNSTFETHPQRRTPRTS